MGSGEGDGAGMVGCGDEEMSSTCGTMRVRRVCDVVATVGDPVTRDDSSWGEQGNEVMCVPRSSHLSSGSVFLVAHCAFLDVENTEEAGKEEVEVEEEGRAGEMGFCKVVGWAAGIENELKKGRVNWERNGKVFMSREGSYR